MIVSFGENIIWSKPLTIGFDRNRDFLLFLAPGYLPRYFKASVLNK
jgi:hypothetical protein